MPVTVKCRSGKCECTFPKLNPGDIEVYECGECSEDKSEAEMPKDSAPEQKEETAAERKARLKAEKEAAKKAQDEAKKAE